MALRAYGSGRIRLRDFRGRLTRVGDFRAVFFSCTDSCKNSFRQNDPSKIRGHRIGLPWGPWVSLREIQDDPAVLQPAWTLALPRSQFRWIDLEKVVREFIQHRAGA